jgi:hypothetical protein
MKIMRGWGKMMACKKSCGWLDESWMARQKLEQVHIFLEEDIHNVALQEEVAKLEMVVTKGEHYIVWGARIWSRI